MDIPEGELQSWSCRLRFSDREMDLVEMAIYGSVNRDELKCKCTSNYEEMQKVIGEKYKSNKDVRPACP